MDIIMMNLSIKIYKYLKLFPTFLHQKDKQDSMYAGSLLDIVMNHLDPIIERAKKGDREAVTKLVQLWYKRIYNYVYKYTGDHDMAMEVTQRTFISMHMNISGLKDTRKFKPWLYRVATNYCLDEERRSRKKWLVSVNDGHGATEVSKFDPDREMQKGEIAEMLLAALNEINADQRKVVIMKEYEGLKFREIAEALRISENTVKSRLYYGLNALRKVLEKRNINKETIHYEL